MALKSRKIYVWLISLLAVFVIYLLVNWLNKTPEIKVLTTKVVLASEDEIKINPRARSAHLRVGEKI